MIHIELMEDKEWEERKEFRDEFASTVATTLRLVKPYFGSGRVVIADSYFGSIPTAVALKKHGLSCIMAVKKKLYWPKKYPGPQLLAGLLEPYGSHYSLSAQVEGYRLYCTALRDRKINLYISTYSTTVHGDRVKRIFKRPDGSSYTDKINRPKIASEYGKGKHIVDDHNQIQQSGNSPMWVVLGVKRRKAWITRDFVTLLQIAWVNTYRAWNHFVQVSIALFMIFYLLTPFPLGKRTWA